MNNARKATRAEVRALEKAVAQLLTVGREEVGAYEREKASDIVAGSGVAVFNDCYIPGVDKPYRGKVLVYMAFSNPLLTEVYIWRDGAWEELPLHAAEA